MAAAIFWTLAAVPVAFVLEDTALAALCVAASAICELQSIKARLGLSS